MFFLSLKILRLSAQRINLTILGLDFLFPQSFFELPILCGRSVCSSFISNFTSLMKVCKTNSSVSSPSLSFFLCSKMYFLLEYCFCPSIFVSKFSKWLRGIGICPHNSLITLSFSPLSSSYFSNFFFW